MARNDFGAPNMLLRRVAVADNRLKPTAVPSRRWLELKVA